MAHYTIIFTIFAYYLIHIFGKSNQQNKRGVDRKKKLSKDGLLKSWARVFNRKLLRLQSSSASLELLFQITENLQVNPKEWINTPDEYFFIMAKHKEQHKKSIRFFNDREVRAVWDEENNKWWFSVLDIIQKYSILLNIMQNMDLIGQ